MPRCHGIEGRSTTRIEGIGGRTSGKFDQIGGRTKVTADNSNTKGSTGVRITDRVDSNILKGIRIGSFSKYNWQQQYDNDNDNDNSNENVNGIWYIEKDKDRRFVVLWFPYKINGREEPHNPVQ